MEATKVKEISMLFTPDMVKANLERWQAGGFATRIDDMNPALRLGIEALKRIQTHREHSIPGPMFILPGETKD